MRIFLLAFVFLPLWGCTAVNSNLVDQIGIRYPVDTHALAIEAADELCLHYYPAKTTFRMEHTETVFGTAFEDALRKLGFAVSETEPSGIPLSYVVDELLDAPGAAYVRINAGGQSFSMHRALRQLR